MVKCDTLVLLEPAQRPQQGGKITFPKKSLCVLVGRRLAREEGEHFSSTLRGGQIWTYF